MKKRIFIGFYDYTVILTYASLIAAISGIFFASRSRFTLAVACVLFSGICDAFDGAVARTKKNRSEDQKSFGIQLDSICDVIAFGVTPACICYFMGADDAFGLICIFFYVLTALIRLSFFNVLEIKRQKTESGCAKYYRGLPATAISIILPIVYSFKFLLKPFSFILILKIVLAAVGMFFILDFRMKKIKFDKILTPTTNIIEKEKNSELVKNKE